MNILALQLENYDPNYLYCLESKANLIMNGNFTKINYTHPHFTMNGLFFLVPISTSFVDYSSENTNFIRFDPGSPCNKAVIDSVVKLEHDVLTYYTALFSCTKTASLSMTKQLSKGKLKINGESAIQKTANVIVLKISGIWENEFEFGITFRWMEAKAIQ